MEVIVTISKDDCWYKDAVGKVFDVKLETHPTFKFDRYILLNTDRNKQYFNYDELTMLFLRDGFMGIGFDHCEQL